MNLSNGASVNLHSLIQGSLSLKGSFQDGAPTYILFGTSRHLLIPYPITWFPTYLLAKEAKTQLDLAMNQALY